MTDDLREAYDSVPYESHPFAQSHPDRLATLGVIFGMTPARIEHCRVLEVGCASGGNILPLAATLPHSEFVGIDFSQVQIERGRADVRALALSNVRLESMDIMQLDDNLGEFDYIVAHGVYSWVPSSVQEKLLAVCADHLAANGIAYISYNTLPGWNMRATVRAAMRYHTRQVRDPQVRVQQARGVLDLLAQFARGEEIGYASMLRAEAAEVRDKADYYVFHEHLEEVNEAFYFHDFIERASSHGLRYLAEANFSHMFTTDLPAAANQAIARLAPDLITREQLIDFLRNRTFRQTLLVHDEVALERKVSPLRVASLRAASRARPVREKIEATDAPEEFRTPDDRRIAVASALAKTAFMILADAWPRCIAFDELLSTAASATNTAAGEAARGMLASALLSAYAAGVIELHYAAPVFTLEPGARPQAGRLQRLHAQRGREITTLRHEELKVDATTRQLLVLMDGLRTRDEIADQAWPGLPHEQRRRLLAEALPQLARQALLIA
ncbi:MAG TPA: class I SAM-dependent methyltransferase [Casimicrobiaceae bacterium]|nr:class I SAM-dependent methyltransferase [Casimicrobiaceae bacterium]